jgi:hypothetical protein
MPNGMQKQDPTSNQALEALIRLKRLERPSADTLEAIERGFRLRQIALSVPRRRWWHGAPRVRRALVSIGGLATVSAAVVALLAPPRVVQQPAPAWGPAERLAETVIYAPRESSAPIQVAAARSATVAPVVESAFVMDVLQRTAPADERFTTLASPETLSSARSEEYVVFTLSASESARRF